MTVTWKKNRSEMTPEEIAALRKRNVILRAEARASYDWFLKRRRIHDAARATYERWVPEARHARRKPIRIFNAMRSFLRRWETA